jgi:serine/threonine-protein kinase HipA
MVSFNDRLELAPRRVEAMTQVDSELECLLKVHANLPRQGPGSDEMTAKALSYVPRLKNGSRVFDMGCGPGRASLVLAQNLQTKIVAVDLVDSFLDLLLKSAAAKGLDHLVEIRRGSMTEISEPEASIDLIWSEGAAYCVGFDHALSIWHPFLKSSGVVSLTELSWLTDSPSKEAVGFWQDNYPAMRSKEKNLQAAEDMGYSCLQQFVLPSSCWWEEYYNPLMANIDRLAPLAGTDAVLTETIMRSKKEISLYERHAKDYGYVFYILQKRSGQIST